ncbi:MAG: hypothetical protein U0163_10585 [Gemmatimonadaceae bacterium]
MRHLHVLRVGAWAALLLVPAIAKGQEREFRFTPYVGYYAPTAKLAQVNTSIGGTDIGGKFEHKNAFTLGATGSYWMNKRVGFEVGGAWAMSDGRATMTINGESQQLSQFAAGQSARVLFGTAKMMVGLLPLGNDSQLRLGFGPAIISRGGNAYKLDAESNGKLTGLTDIGGAVSLCTRIPMTSLLAVRLRAEDYMYQSQLKFQSHTSAAENFNFDKKFQHDFIFSAGLQIGFRR